MRDSAGSLFFTPHGGITPASFFILIGMPMMLSGRVLWGFLVVLLGLVSALRQAMTELKESDKKQIRYDVLSPDEILGELEALEESEERSEDGKIQCWTSLLALAKKYNKKEQGQESLPLLCQQAAYLSLKIYPEDDMVVSSAISLMALVAKLNSVRQRHKFQADQYGLNVIINSLKSALDRAKKEEDESREELLAEIQRKGALLLGALSDEDKDFDLPTQIVEEDGLELILDAANWFRLHEEVANWTLWAIFTICYDQVLNKVQLVRLAGITTVCELMKNNPSSLEVNRHGVAILFDVLREGNESQKVKWDQWEVRRLALAAGMHKVISNAMTEFSDSMDIMMMGQELLIGTGYRGDIPQYQQL